MQRRTQSLKRWGSHGRNGRGWAVLSVAAWLGGFVLTAVAGGCGSQGSQPEDDTDLSQASGVVPQSSCEANVDCTAGQTCDPLHGCVDCQFDDDCRQDEVCVGLTCVAAQECSSDEDCGGGAARTCSEEDGICRGCQSDDQCAAGEICRAGGLCLPDVSCDSGACESCDDDEDCPDDYFCGAGVCRLALCQPGSSRCSAQGSALLTCRDDGRGLEEEACDTREVCSAQDGEASCRYQICTPGAVSCSDDGLMMQLCEPDGLSFSPLADCSAEQGRCEEKDDTASCADVVCVPESLTCMNGDSYACSELGTQLVLSESCGYGDVCQGGECKSRLCTPYWKSCTSGGLLRTCNAKGDGYSNVEDCSLEGQACFDGACEPVVCSYDTKCEEGHVWECVDAGTRERRSDWCSPGEYCHEAPEGSASCKTDVCEQGETYCRRYADEIVRCNDTGSEVLQRVDCYSGSSCGIGDGCEFDVGAGETTLSADQAVAVNHFVATEDSVLVGLRQRGSASSCSWCSRRDVQIVIFESPTATGRYELVYSESDTYKYSIYAFLDDLMVPVKAGHYYLIGFVPSGYADGDASALSAGEQFGPLTWLGSSRLADETAYNKPLYVEGEPENTTVGYEQSLAFRPAFE